MEFSKMWKLITFSIDACNWYSHSKAKISISFILCRCDRKIHIMAHTFVWLVPFLAHTFKAAFAALHLFFCQWGQQAATTHESELSVQWRWEYSAQPCPINTLDMGNHYFQCATHCTLTHTCSYFLQDTPTLPSLHNHGNHGYAASRCMYLPQCVISDTSTNTQCV